MWFCILWVQYFEQIVITFNDISASESEKMLLSCWPIVGTSCGIKYGCTGRGWYESPIFHPSVHPQFVLISFVHCIAWFDRFSKGVALVSHFIFFWVTKSGALHNSSAFQNSLMIFGSILNRSSRHVPYKYGNSSKNCWWSPLVIFGVIKSCAPNNSYTYWNSLMIFGSLVR